MEVDIVNPDQKLSTNATSHQFCTLCLRVKLANVEFYKNITGSSGELQTTLQTILGYDFRLPGNYAICMPCWTITQLIQDFRQQCWKSNILMERTGQGLKSDDSWFSKKALASIGNIRTLVKDQLELMERLDVSQSEADPLTSIDRSEIKVEPDDGMAGLEWLLDQEDGKDIVEESKFDVREIKTEPEAMYIEPTKDHKVKTKPDNGMFEFKISSGSYSCPECPQLFTSQTKLAAHVMKHAGNTKYRCRNNCEKDFASTKNRRRHERKCGNEVFKCNLCEVQTSRRVFLYEHYRLSHPGEPKHPCLYCEKRFQKKEQLQRHTGRIHNKQDSFNCEKCGKKLLTKYSMELHKARKHPEQASEVGKKYLAQRQLVRQLRVRANPNKKNQEYSEQETSSGEDLSEGSGSD